MGTSRLDIELGDLNVSVIMGSLVCLLEIFYNEVIIQKDLFQNFLITHMELSR